MIGSEPKSLQRHRVALVSYVVGLDEVATRKRIPLAVLVDFRVPGIYGVGFQAKSRDEFKTWELESFSSAMRHAASESETWLQDLIAPLTATEDGSAFSELPNQYRSTFRVDIVRDHVGSLPFGFGLMTKEQRRSWARKKIAKKLNDQFMKLELGNTAPLERADIRKIPKGPDAAGIYRDEASHRHFGFAEAA